jgi:uncharacterized protein
MLLPETLLPQISSLEVVDCHEHTFIPEARPVPVDLWTIVKNSDMGDDLISAGMPVSFPAELSWDRAAPYLPLARNTGFYRSLVLAFQNLFDFPEAEIKKDNWEALSKQIVEANSRPDWYSFVLHEKGRVKTILRVQGNEPDPLAVDRRFFAPLINLDEWITADADEWERAAAKAGGNARSLKHYLAALDQYFERIKAGDAVGIKSMLAYRRSLDIAFPDEAAVQRLFDKRSRTAVESKAVEDFLIHQIAERAGRYRLPYQVHVGYGSWQTNITARANPLLLNAFIESHRATSFVMLHGGYPFTAEMGTLAKNHPNAFIEAGWLAYISPRAYEQAMGEWLDSVPMNKILAFGADCLHIEQTYGALVLTRQLLSRVMAEKIAGSGWSEALALECAVRLMSKNAAEVYRLEG